MANPGSDDEGFNPRGLRLLQVLVTTLTAVMIVAGVVVTAILWLGYSNARAPLPDVITLPSGETATAFTQGDTWYAVVTSDDEILIFDRRSGAVRQRIAIETP